MTVETLVALKVYVIGGWFAFLFLVERVASAAPWPAGRTRIFKNAVLWILVLLASPLIVLPLTMFAVEHPLWTREGLAAGWPGLVADFLILDLWTFWLHRAYHANSFMWRFHKPHHLDEHLDTTTAVRFHIGEVVLSAALRMAPIVLLAMPLSHVIVFETVLLSSALFHHSNVRLPEAFERALSKLIVTPSIHWVHHHKTAADTNSNYAAILSIWDPLFRTRSATRRTPEMAIGVEKLGDEPILGLLTGPFREDRA